MSERTTQAEIDEANPNSKWMMERNSMFGVEWYCGYGENSYWTKDANKGIHFPCKEALVNFWQAQFPKDSKSFPYIKEGAGDWDYTYYPTEHMFNCSISDEIPAKKIKPECGTCATSCDWPDSHNCKRYEANSTHAQEVEEQMLSTIVADYVDYYEFRGDEGDYYPTEEEKLLITDAIFGLIEDDDFKAKLHAKDAATIAQLKEEITTMRLERGNKVALLLLDIADEQLKQQALQSELSKVRAREARNRDALEKIAFMGLDVPMQGDAEFFYNCQLRNCIAIAANELRASAPESNIDQATRLNG